MSLRIRLILVTTAVVTVLFGISEWLSYRQTAALLDEHERILVETSDHTVALQTLRATRARMFLSATTMRILHAAGTLVIAVAILNYVWYRVIYRPIRRLLSQINIMGRGTWKSALPVKRNDEIGELTTAFNDLGQQLTSTFHHINTSSKLSALALVGSRLVREVRAVREQIVSSTRSLEGCTGPAIETAITTLTEAHGHLERLESQFQKDFDEELSAVSMHPPTADKQNQRVNHRSVAVTQGQGKQG
jgi:HAMP domain-containing protein